MIRAGVPFRPSVPGCDYCYRLSRVLFRVAVVPHTGRAGDVCAACRVLIDVPAVGAGENGEW